MTATNPFWGRKTFCLITGASQGIGRQIAIEFSKHVKPESTFLLLARNVENLNETKRLMGQENPNINVITHSYNFCEPIGVELHKLMNISLVTSRQDVDSFELCMIVHNAGSLGDITETVAEIRNLEKLDGYFMLNIHSVILLNAEFIKCFRVDTNKAELCFINITSLCAIKPMASMGYYCMGKATREMYFGVLAAENPDFTVLNYAPGPVDTEMAGDIAKNVQNEELRGMFSDMKQNGTILSPKQTIEKLAEVLRERKFVSGSRVDYYDN